MSESPAGNRRAAMQQEKERQQRQQKIGSRVLVGVTIAAVLAVVGLIVWVALSASGSRPVGGPAGEQQAAGPILVGTVDAPVTIAIHQDYSCPPCGIFETTNTDVLVDAVLAGVARVELHTMSFLDGPDRWSTRAANAVHEVAAGSPEHVLVFNAALFAHQDSQLSDADLAEVAQLVGVPASVAELFRLGRFETAVEQITEASSKAGVSRTPTVFLNGMQYLGAIDDPDEFAAAINTAAGSSQS